MPGAFEVRHAAQKRESISWSQRHGVEKLAGVQEAGDDRIFLRHLIHGCQQFQQLVLPLMILFQRALERQMPRAPSRIDPRRISGKKSKWPLFIPTVLDQVEVNPIHLAGAGGEGLEPLFHAAFETADSRPKGLLKAIPDIGKEVRIGVIYSNHGGHVRQKFRAFLPAQDGLENFTFFFAFRIRADPADPMAGKSAPELERRRIRDTLVGLAQRHQPFCAMAVLLFFIDIQQQLLPMQAAAILRV